MQPRGSVRVQQYRLVPVTAVLATLTPTPSLLALPKTYFLLHILFLVLSNVLTILALWWMLFNRHSKYRHLVRFTHFPRRISIMLLLNLRLGGVDLQITTVALSHRGDDDDDDDGRYRPESRLPSRITEVRFKHELKDI